MRFNRLEKSAKVKTTRRKCEAGIKAGFYMFLLIFQHKWLFLSRMQTLPFNGHNVAYRCKGLDQHCVLKNNVKYQDHLKVTVTMLHVGEKVLT